MKTIRGDIRNLDLSLDPLALTVGNFDGLHLGHKYLIDELKRKGQEQGLKIGVLSFSPHPSHVIGDKPCDLLMSAKDKEQVLKGFGVDYFFDQNFSKEFAQLSPEDFLRQYLFACYSPKLLLFGYDFSFGRGGAGAYSMAAQFGEDFGCETIQGQVFEIEGESVSSTKIRNFLKLGRVSQARSMLGRGFRIEGVVKKGEQMGRKLGFPTANLHDVEQIIPANGVYSAVIGRGQKKYPGILNIGVKPTLSCRGEKSIECHLFNLNEDMYGETLEVEFIDRIRGEQKFDGIDSLVLQIKKDIEIAKKHLERSIPLGR